MPVHRNPQQKTLQNPWEHRCAWAKQQQAAGSRHRQRQQQQWKREQEQGPESVVEQSEPASKIISNLEA